MHTKTIRELRLALDQKQLSSVEVTQHFLQRIATHNATLNAFITVDAEKSLAQAKAADARLAAGERGPLLGTKIFFAPMAGALPAARRCWRILSPLTMRT
jgi:aspartyl-tRNA(Asn)/glutamyl-tRNA(Gln) amidotransferase subunit A